MFPSFINTPYITHKTQNLLAKFKTSHQMKGVPTPPPTPFLHNIMVHTSPACSRKKNRKTVVVVQTMWLCSLDQSPLTWS